MSTTQDVYQDTAPTTVDVFSEFDRICQSLPETGLACFAAAAAQLHHRFPEEDLKLQTFYSPSSHYHPAALVPRSQCALRIVTSGLRKASESRSHIEVQLPSLRLSRSSKSSEGGFTNDIESVQATVRGRWKDSSAHVNAAGFYHTSCLDETGLLTKMSLTVFENLCGTLPFTSYESIVKSFARAILRVLNFAHPGVELYYVNVTACLSEEHHKRKITAEVAKASMSSFGADTDSPQPPAPVEAYPATYGEDPPVTVQSHSPHEHTIQTGTLSITDGRRSSITTVASTNAKDSEPEQMSSGLSSSPATLIQQQKKL